jgi:hypothetical protein
MYFVKIEVLDPTYIHTPRAPSILTRNNRFDMEILIYLLEELFRVVTQKEKKGRFSLPSHLRRVFKWWIEDA